MRFSVAMPFLALIVGCVGLATPALRAAETSAPPDFAPRWLQIRDAATPAQLYRLLYDLPKGGDIHHHHGGAGWPEDWLELATDPARNGNNTFHTRISLAAFRDGSGEEPLLFKTVQQSAFDKLPADQRADYKPLTELTPAERDAWCASLRLDRTGEGRDEFFEKTWPRLGALLRSLDVTLALLVKNMQRFAAEGVRYLEPQVGLFGFLDNDGRPVTPERALARYRETLGSEAARATGVTVRFQHTILRFKPDAEQDLADTYKFMDAHRDLFVGVNMAGREDRQIGHPRRFLPAFRELRRKYSGIQISIHAGETDEPDRHVRDTLLLGATRIGHAVNLIDDPETMLDLRARDILVEINLISNRVLEYVPDLTKHPFPEYLRFGIPVCLNTDDRGMWGSDMTDEYFTAVTHFALTWSEIVTLGRNSLAYSFAQPEVKRAMLADYERRVRAFEDKYRTAGDWTTALPQPDQIVVSWYAERNFSLK